MIRTKGKKKRTKPVRKVTAEKPPPTEEEIEILKGDVKRATIRANALRKSIAALKESSIWLHEEVAQVRADNREYLKAVQSRMEERQEELKEVRRKVGDELALVEKEGEEKVAALQQEEQELVYEGEDKEAELERLKLILTDLKPYKQMQIQQTTELKKLEVELQQLKINQEQKLDEIKCSFVRERRDLSEHYRSEMAYILHSAKVSVGPALAIRLSELKASNIQLQRHLRKLTERQKSLTAQKAKLARQREMLLLKNDCLPIPRNITSQPASDTATTSQHETSPRTTSQPGTSATFHYETSSTALQQKNLGIKISAQNV